MTYSKHGFVGRVYFLLCQGLLMIAAVFSGLSIVNAAIPGAVAAPCTLTWAPSPYGNVAGYAVYYGINGSSLTIRVDTGAAPTLTFYNLSANATYFFYVVAYDANGQESIPSSVITYQPPILSPLALDLLPDGTINVSFRTMPGKSCRVEFTSSLVDPVWQTLGNAVADSDGNVSLFDPLPGRPPTRFYRAVRLP